MRPLTSLLTHHQQESISTPAAWQERRSALQQAWLDFLGPFPPAPSALNITVLEEEQLDGFIRQRIEFVSEMGFDSQPVATQEAYLLLPAQVHKPACPPPPAVVYFHATSDDSYHIPAGLAGNELRHHGVHLAQRGWVVIAPRNYLYGYRGFLKDAAVSEFKRIYPQRLGMSKMLWDGLRSLDVLTSLPFVDQQRLVTMGHSLGAKEALYLAAFDERVRAAVSSEGGIGLDFSNWDAPWYLGEGIHEVGFTLEHHQLLALVAPRAFLLIGGDTAGSKSADGIQSQPYMDAAQEVYRLLRVPERLHLIIHDEGHAFPEPILQQAYSWLEQQIQ